MPRHVFGDRGLANGDSKFEKLAMDPRRAPEAIGQAHVADQLANFERDLWSAVASISTSIARTNENQHDATE